jgi:hypothetical protein
MQTFGGEKSIKKARRNIIASEGLGARGRQRAEDAVHIAVANRSLSAENQ